MFVATNANPNTEMPPNCTFSESDWHVLAGFWHPVAFSADVQDKPVAARLLDVNLVLYRTVDGVAAAKDICVHRGAALSLGWLDDQKKNIVCPFHGLHYDVNGRCTKIPSLAEDQQRIPSRLCTMAYQVQERYGLIWVCMKKEAVAPLPDWSHMETRGEGWTTVHMPQGVWHASAARHVENFMDVAHFSWVHVRTFGNRKHPHIPNYEVKRKDNALAISLPYPEVTGIRLNGNEDEISRNVVYDKEVSYPFSCDLLCRFRREDGEEDLTEIFDVASPVSTKETAIFQIIQTNVRNARPEDMMKYQMLVNSEDIPLVESQKPEQIPLNMAAEIHIPADKLSIQYRRDLVERFGLGSPEIVA